ncbi:hypothetical protein PT974_00163 [Cladobotryum mycophilum]|uniref:Histidine acid phosphatase n=1 Tax=Cladobotryum mycophilum TaxID=491253 RepID=A0ABR0T1F2_9HYPO
MTPLRSLRLQMLHAPLLLVLLAVGVHAQASSNKVWAAVAFINHGEKTPDFGGLQTVLTPAGAQQMLRQGAAFRSRYLSGSTSERNSSSANAIGLAPIQNIAVDAIDNSQLDILSQQSQWVTGGAMAFLQGLYPANKGALNSLAGGEDLVNDFAANSSQTSYPLGGYQYPNIQSFSSNDPASVVVQGTVGCNAWYNNANATTQKALAERVKATQSFYESLFSSAPLKGTISIDQANYGNAYEIYELINYLYTHNQTVFNGLFTPNDTLAELRSNAFELELATNGHNNTNTDNASLLPSIAGTTLARKVIDAFITSVKVAGSSDKLTLIFGSYESMLALLSLSGLYTRDNLLSGPFSTLPQPGAAMVFELISDSANDATSMPSAENLSIRFTYRATADDDDEPFTTYSLFASGFDGQTIPYTGFLTAMQKFTRDSSQWCDMCHSTTAPWCSSRKKSVTTPVAGAIGAILTIFVIGIGSLLLYGIGACHFGASEGSSERNNHPGGFKGAEKMASDTDLAVTKGGSQHERVGSWELSDGNNKPSTGSIGIVTEELGRDTLRMPRSLDEDGISLNGATPVKVHEGV